MKLKLVATALFALTATANLAGANDTIAAWQEAGYVMEEVIVTAPRVAVQPMLAWQEPGYVMEEVIATAARGERPQTRARMRVRMRQMRFAGIR